jgi:predicted lipoprotein with Yx(FWY)xxD motif
VNRTLPAIVVLALGALLVVSGCGGGSSSSSSAEGGAYGGEATGDKTTAGDGEASGGKAASTGGGSGTVAVAMSPELGKKIIVDEKGLTLYDFHKDKGTTSACYGPCAQGWPPMTTEGEPQAGNGASAGKLGTTERKDGTLQVTYAGHPLYTFVEDKKPGEANGNDISAFGGEWYALQGNGEEPKD